MKQKRQDVIIELITHHDIETQDDLAVRLEAEGFKVTQATVSRDIKELRLVKVPAEGGAYKYAVPGMAQVAGVDDKQRAILSQAVQSVEHAQNLVVIKTFSGMAQAAAAVIDGMRIHEVVGSIAGDDTILCITRDTERAALLVGKLKMILE